MSYWVICIPLFFMGVGMPMYYVPLTGLAMGSVNEEETASAAGLMNFVRTISGAIATSLVTTSWQNRSIIAHAKLADVVDPTGQVASRLPPGLNGQLVREMLKYLVTSQSLMLATNGLMIVIGVVFVIASVSIVLAPKAARAVDAASGRTLNPSPSAHEVLNMVRAQNKVAALAGKGSPLDAGLVCVCTCRMYCTPAP